jgi:hypothetical protein
MLKRRLAGSGDRGGGWCRVIRTVDQGLDPFDEIGAPALSAATIMCDTPPLSHLPGIR